VEGNQHAIAVRDARFIGPVTPSGSAENATKKTSAVLNVIFTPGVLVRLAKRIKQLWKK